MPIFIILPLIQIALISLFGRKLIGSFRLRFGLHREIFIIKGNDKNALLLGKNIADHDGEQKRPDPNQLVVFLPEKEDEEEEYNKETNK